MKAMGEYLGVTFAESNPRKRIKRSKRPLGNLPLEILNHFSSYVHSLIENDTLKVGLYQNQASTYIPRRPQPDFEPRLTIPQSTVFWPSTKCWSVWTVCCRRRCLSPTRLPFRRLRGSTYSCCRSSCGTTFDTSQSPEPSSQRTLSSACRRLDVRLRTHLATTSMTCRSSCSVKNWNWTLTASHRSQHPSQASSCDERATCPSGH